MVPPDSSDQARKGDRTLKIVMLLVFLPFVAVAIIGILAAIAIPSFISYTKRAKTAEAQTNIMTIANGLEVFRAENLGVPDSIPLTPASPNCEMAPWPVTADPRWESDLRFSPVGPLHYAYEFERTGNRFTIRAVGDLDCDGRLSRFERSGTVQPFTIEPDTQVIDELE
ncbi:MAG: hypothetical protein AAGF12_41430 [Myxococcota bacterium]